MPTPLHASRPFHGEFASADASALSEPNSRFTLYEDGVTTTITLAAGETTVITDIEIVCVSALRAWVYDGANNAVDAGEIAAVANFIATASVPVHLRAAVPHSCQVGTYPKLKTTAAGQIDAKISGFIQS